MTRSEIHIAARLALEYPMSLDVYEQYAKGPACGGLPR